MVSKRPSRVSRDIIEHKLDIDPKIKPKKQKLRKMSDDKVAEVKAEVQRLLDAKVIREVKYPTWLANTVPVKKKRQMENVYRLHRFKQSLSKRRFPLTKDRQSC